MAATVIGIQDWGVERDDEGHRTYTIDWLVKKSPPDGPSVVFSATGLAAIGSPWSYGGSDPSAFCYPTLSVRRYTKDPEKDIHFLVTQTWSTRPLRRCQTETIENPLLEPPQLRGSFSKEKQEQLLDKDGEPIRMPNGQMVRGSLIEQDFSKPSIVWTFNTSILLFDFAAMYIDTLNDSTLYGFPKRCVKFSDYQFERLLFGTCAFYYRNTIELAVNEKTFDRPIIAEGDYELVDGKEVRYTDTRGSAIKILLDENGRKLASDAEPHQFKPKQLPEGNLLLLGIPSSLV